MHNGLAPAPGQQQAVPKHRRKVRQLGPVPGQMAPDFRPRHAGQPEELSPDHVRCTGQAGHDRQAGRGAVGRLRVGGEGLRRGRVELAQAEGRYPLVEIWEMEWTDLKCWFDEWFCCIGVT